MSHQFCQNCGKQQAAGTKFCGDCGQLQAAAVAPSAFPATLNQADLSGGGRISVAGIRPNTRTLLIAGGAAFTVLILVLVFFVIKPFSGASLEGKSASQIVDQLTQDGFCSYTYSRSDWDQYDALQAAYDRDELRKCEDPQGDAAYIYGNLSLAEVENEVDLSIDGDYTIVSGDSWVIEFDGGKYVYANDAAETYGGIVRN